MKQTFFVENGIGKSDVGICTKGEKQSTKNFSKNFEKPVDF